MIFSKETYNDIIRYYKDTVIKLKESGDRLWKVDYINSNEVQLTDTDGFHLYLDLNDPYEVDYPLPGRAVFQMGDVAALLVRKPAKQYKRGLSNENTSLVYLSDTMGWRSLDFSIHTLQQFVDKPCYQTIGNDYGLSSVALSPVFSYCNQDLYALNKKIGIINKDTKTVSLITSLFKPEIKQLLPEGWTVQ